MPIDSAERFASTRRPLAAKRTAWPMTQRSISPISPYFSATGRKLPGGMISPSCPTIRSSSSWLGCPPASGMIGCEYSDEPVFVERVPDAPNPGERVQLALDSVLLGLLLAGVAKHDNDATTVLVPVSSGAAE